MYKTLLLSPIFVTIIAEAECCNRAPARLKALPGLLYPRESETRVVKSLDGLWDFAVADDKSGGSYQSWYRDKLSKSVKVRQMPVPSSYNDVTISREIRDHVGVVWYEREFFVPSSWSNQRIFVRFGSVNYLAHVWINGILVTTHEMGNLPFEVEITRNVFFGRSNRITVSVDNRLGPISVPQGKVTKTTTDGGSEWIQLYSFDFFNYAGIHRSVLLSTRPRVYIADITVQTLVSNDTGVIAYLIAPAGLKHNEIPICKVTVRDNATVIAVEPVKCYFGTLRIPQVKLWWAVGMDENPGYLYELEVTLFVGNSTDVYRLPIGVRTVKWNSTSLLLNDKPLYLRGFGRHEDSDIRGRGFDLAVMTRDHELLKWIGANAYRTSHYPYSDETMDMADRRGFLIIDECPSVDTDNFSPELLTKHQQSISELMRRDKNHPSVIMWSIANEPRTHSYAAKAYFQEVAQHAKSLDPTRPITAALAGNYEDDQVAQFLDVIGFNRYNSWYANSGRLDMIIKKVMDEATGWNRKHNKPIIMMEYGADTEPGLHEFPEYVWSEEFQTAALCRHFEAFDRLRQRGWFIGEFIWNFADFRTAQTYTRVGGNKKGIFTRTRQPKRAAHHVRKRYHALAFVAGGAETPKDLQCYVSDFKKYEDL